MKRQVFAVVMLLSASADASATSNPRKISDVTPLAKAVMANDLNLVRRLLRKHADMDAADVTGVGPLALAIENGDPEVVAALLAAGADPNRARETGETPLMTAVWIGSVPIVRQLLAAGAKADPRETRNGQTALIWAADKPEIAKLLLAAGADPNARSAVRITRFPRYRPKIAILGNAGEPWAHDGEFERVDGGSTALIAAVRTGAYDTVRALLDAGADVSGASADGTTPLLAALYNWRLIGDGIAPVGFDSDTGEKAIGYAANAAIAVSLLDAGASARTADRAGYTPLHGALLALLLAKIDTTPRLAFVGYRAPNEPPLAAPATQGTDPMLALVRRLLAQGADPNAQTRQPTPGPVNAVHINRIPVGSTPLHMAVAVGRLDLVTALLAAGADPNRMREDGHTPFTLAVIDDDIAIVRLLLRNGADLQRTYDPLDEIADPEKRGASRRQGQSILHLAAVANAAAVVPLLVVEGASGSARNRQGETPLDLADRQERFRSALAGQRPSMQPGAAPVRDTTTTDTLKRLSAIAMSTQRPRRSRAAATMLNSSRSLP